MKSYLVITLLVVNALLSATNAADTCKYFTDTNGKCVEKCTFPKVYDVPSRKCLENIDSCKTFFLKELQYCLEKCPYGFTAQSDKDQSFQACVPCPFKDSKGNCFQQCPSPMISDFTTQSCLDSPSNCTGYYIKGQEICLKQCPIDFIAVDKESPKTCVNSKILGKCSTNNSNNSNVITCNGKLSADKSSCGQTCPAGQYVLEAVSGQSYQQCQQCPSDKQFVNYAGSACVSACENTQAIDKQTLNCIEKEMCETDLIEDKDGKSWCVKQFSDGYAQEVVENMSYVHCAQCSDGQFFDQSTKKCISQCDIPDALGKSCLSSINDCFGFISSDQKKCSNSCAENEFIEFSDIFNQFFCLVKCSDQEYVFEKQIGSNKYKICLKNCPPFYFANSSNNCVSISDCSTFISMDGQQCLDQCPIGQFANTIAKNTKNAKICKPCMQKLSSDGSTCSQECASGELYDLDQKQCILSSNCKNIINSDSKTCQKNCQIGQLLLTDTSGNQSCINAKNCTQKISSDKLSCIASCSENEASIVQDKLTFCIICPLGVSDDKASCLKECANSQVFDVQSKKCIAQDSCTGMISVNGKRCVQKCEFPEVKSSLDAKKCQKDCSAGEVYQKEDECISAASCKTYVSSNGLFCVDLCGDILEIVDNDSSTPKTCKKCSDGQIPQIQDDKSVKCIDKSTDNSKSIKDQTENIQKSLQDKTELSPAEKKVVKENIQQIAQDVDDNIKETHSNSDLSAEDKKVQIKSMIDNIKNAAQQFINKLKSNDVSANIQSDENGDDENKLSLGSEQFQLFAEKKKAGFAFKLKLNLKDLLTSSSPSLQADVSSTDVDTQTNSNIDTMTVSNQTINPNCDDTVKCPTGLISVETTQSTRRLLESGSDQTFQVTYDVDSTKIDKTVCASYDNSTGGMSLTATTTDKTNSQITCTFSNNSSLFYDSSCDYVNSSNCQSISSTSTTSTTTTPSVTQDSTITNSLKLGAYLTLSCVLGLLI